MTRMLDEMMAGSEVVLAYDGGVVAKCTRIPGGTVTAKLAPDVDKALDNLEAAMHDPSRRGTQTQRGGDVHRITLTENEWTELVGILLGLKVSDSGVARGPLFGGLLQKVRDAQ